MKKTRRDRKMYNEGKRDGYLEGYKQGLHDGNPFIAIAESISKIMANVSDKLKDPDVIQALMNATESSEVNEEGQECEYTEIDY